MRQVSGPDRFRHQRLRIQVESGWHPTVKSYEGSVVSFGIDLSVAVVYNLVLLFGVVQICAGLMIQTIWKWLYGDNGNNDVSGGGGKHLTQGGSHWDKLPEEIKEYVFGFASPLTLLVNDRLTIASQPTFESARGLWLEALECDWQGNLSSLPRFNAHPPLPMSTSSRYDKIVPLTNADLSIVTSRETFSKLCALLPHATESNSNFSTIDNEIMVLAFESDTSPFVTKSSHKYLAKQIRMPRLIHIPMRRMWLDVIDGWIRRVPYACAVLCITEGHGALLRHIMQTGTIDLDRIGKLQKRISGQDAPTLCDEAASDGYSDIMQVLHPTSALVLTTAAMNGSAKHGHLDVVKWLHDNRDEGCTTDAMDNAAQDGHLDIVEWLHGNRREGCTTSAMDKAASNGHLRVVQFLHENRVEGCTTKAMDYAAGGGHLPVVQWLHEHREEGCTKWALDWSSGNGHLDIVKWLHCNRTEGCTQFAMDEAARLGHIKIVKWLHENRTEGCTTNAMDQAAKEGHTDIVNWLHANRHEGCTEFGLCDAARYGHDDIVRFLVTQRHIHIRDEAIIDAKTDDVAVFLIQHIDVARRQALLDDPLVTRRVKELITRVAKQVN